MATSEGHLSLAEFAAAKKPAPACRVCEIPEVKEINAARLHGVSYKNIAEWLVAVRGYEPGRISHHRVEKHFHEHHDG